MIRFEQVRFSYARDTRAVLDGLTMRVRQGELLAVVGPSGCGKSTALKLINRLLDPTGGRVLVNERATTDTSALDLRRGIGVVFQHGGLFSHLTVEENLWLVAKLAGWSVAQRRERSEELLRTVGLEPEQFARRHPAQLSGGQRQRVSFARAIFLRQKIVLLDEPFSALDPLTRDELQRFFRDLQRELGLTVVMVTHDMAEALLMADQIAVMEGGVAVAYGTPSELLRAEGPPLLRRLLDTPLRQTERIDALLLEASVGMSGP